MAQDQADTVAGGMDALTHCVEAWLGTAWNPPADGMALEACAAPRTWLPRAEADGTDLDARREMLAAALNAGPRQQKGLGAVHALAHALEAESGMTARHGWWHAALLPPAISFNAPASPTGSRRLPRSLASRRRGRGRGVVGPGRTGRPAEPRPRARRPRQGAGGGAGGGGPGKPDQSPSRGGRRLSAHARGRVCEQASCCIAATQALGRKEVRPILPARRGVRLRMGGENEFSASRVSRVFGRVCLYNMDRAMVPHGHREGHLIFHVSGPAGKLVVDGQHFPLSPGQAVAISPGRRTTTRPSR